MANLDLKKHALDYSEKAKKTHKRLIVCAGTGCVASGSLKIKDALVERLKKEDIPVTVDLKKEDPNDAFHISGSGCQGFCQMGPLLNILPDDITYVKVKLDDVDEIIEKTLKNGEIIERLLYVDPATRVKCKGQGEIPFYTRQDRFILKNCGSIDPGDMDEYISKNGYLAAEKAFTQMNPEEVCKELLDSGLRGRGGGGFPTGRKLELTRIQKSEKKFVICNGDEGDPGAFMDRSIMEGNPHSVIEGMMIAARAVGADEGYVYVRTEYPLAVKRMKNAVTAAENIGLLGENVFDSGLNFKLHVMEGAGAFVCGEETALMGSIEGRRGMPTPKPPFPAQSGLQGKPTVINNVETLATLPVIINIGARAFRKIGTDGSPGTKTFALTGHVANTGLIEVPFGCTLREIIFNIGGGVTDKDGNIDNDNFKAVQIGGPSGGCLTEEHLDIPMDFDSLQSIGAMVGSGGLVVMNKNTCMLQVAKFFMQFAQNESCGKCVPCREGTRQMLSMLNDIVEGKADRQTLADLEELAYAVKKSSLCGLGKTAPSPVLSTLRYFKDECDAHVDHHRCPAGKCSAFKVLRIIPDKCKGCTLCARKCPVNAISGKPKQLHVIDTESCIKCGACVDACKFNAIEEAM
jgi:NADH-quinone oxidoreductase subunit F